MGYNNSVDWWAFGVLLYEMVAGHPPFFADQPFQIYEKIVSSDLQFYDFFSEELCNLITNLLQRDITKRFGNLRKGAEDIKQHAWFGYVVWDDVYERKLTPPLIPFVESEGDFSNFETYETIPIANAPTDEFTSEFA